MDNLLLGQYMESSGIGAVTMGNCSVSTMDPKKDSGSIVLTKDQRIEKVEDFKTTETFLGAFSSILSMTYRRPTDHQSSFCPDHVVGPLHESGRKYES